MNIIVWGVLIIIGIGILVIGIPLLGLALFLWWLALPIIGACFGGWIGFFFGIGLDVVIYIVYRCLKSFKEDIKGWSIGKKEKEVAIPKQIKITLPKDVTAGLKK